MYERFACTYVCAPFVCFVAWEANRFPGTWVMMVWATTGLWELNSSPLEEQAVLLTNEPFLKLPQLSFNIPTISYHGDLIPASLGSRRSRVLLVGRLFCCAGRSNAKCGETRGPSIEGFYYACCNFCWCFFVTWARPSNSLKRSGLAGWKTVPSHRITF